MAATGDRPVRGVRRRPTPRTARWVAAVGLSLAAAAAYAQPLFPPFTAQYRVHSRGFEVAAMERRLHRRPDGRWVLATRMQPVGLLALFRNDRILERSIWTYRDGTLIPFDYLRRRSNGEEKEEEWVDFDWDARTATAGHEDGERTLALEPGLLDKLSYQVLLRRDLAAGLKEMRYRVVEAEETEVYRFRVVGEERLQTPLGALDTVKVERLHDSERRRTLFWCAPRLDYLMVRIFQDEKGDLLTGEITTLETAGDQTGRSPGGPGPSVAAPSRAVR